MLRSIFFVFFLFCLVRQDANADKSFNPLKLIKEPYCLDANTTLPYDTYIGNVDAPVVIVDYSSFSCVGCNAVYNNVFAKLRKKYIDSGKVLLIIRDFPLDLVSLKASLLLRCYDNKLDQNNNKDDAILSAITALFDASNSVKNEDNFDKKLREIGKNNMNLDKTQVSCCLENTEIKNQILHSKLFAIKSLRIKGTPKIYINGTEYRGSLNLNDFIKKIDEILAKELNVN